jgi:hypothetical protein
MTRYTLLNTFPNTASLSKFTFASECTIYHSTFGRNVVFWAKENLHFMFEFEHNPLHVTWASATATHLNGPCFFDGPVNTALYAELLEAWLIPQLGDVWLQHNGAPAHSTLVCNIFKKHFASCWISYHLPAVL